MTIKEARQKAHLTQLQASEYVSVPLRTFSRYELNDLCCSDIKREYIIKRLEELSLITETKGILKMQQIRDSVSTVCKKNDVSLCILFGSYAKGTPTEKSDVDLLIDSDKTGLDFYGLLEEFKTVLCKKVDVIRLEDIMVNKVLLQDILKEGVKLYG